METRAAVKYGRVSSKEQEKEGFSIPAQWKLLDRYAKEERFKIVQEFVDIETAKKPGRPASMRWSNSLSGLRRCVC